MATLEEAAEQLVVKLKGLDSEIQESEHALDDLRRRVEAASTEVDEEWSSLEEAVSAFTVRLREERDGLTAGTQEALRAAADAADAVGASGAEARSEVAEGVAGVDAVARHAQGLEPGMESLVVDGGEAPAQGLAERVKAIEEQLAAALQEACAFLGEDVASALDDLVNEVGEHCRRLRERIADVATDRLPDLFAQWERSVDELEEHVATRGFAASRAHARTVVEWALSECATRCDQGFAALEAPADEAVQSLQDLAGALCAAAETLTAEASAIAASLTATHESAARAVAGLDAVKNLLASFSFVSA